MKLRVIVGKSTAQEFHAQAEVRLDPVCENRGWLSRKLFGENDGFHRVTCVLPYEIPVGQTREVTIFENKEIIKMATLTVVARLDGCSVLVGEKV